jgi:octaprenyl-diphosphate synthase
MPATMTPTAPLETVYDFLAADLDAVRSRLADAYQVQGDLMQEVADYVGGKTGKLLRPVVVLLSAHAHNIDAAASDHHVRLAAAIELLHTATLLHDDVIDRSSLRRGRATVNAKWGDDVAILFADYLYATSFDLALSTLSASALRLLSQTTQRMTEGEFLQIERRGQWLGVEDYFSIIRGKTGVLFSAAAGLGALIAGADDKSVERMARFGIDFGLAFQITDDTLDYEAQMDRWGKRVGADLAEGKQTLPLLRTLELATADDRAALEAVLNDGRDFPTVQRFVHKYDAITYSHQVARDHIAAAMDHLSAVRPTNQAIEHLKLVTEQVVSRQF